MDRDRANRLLLPADRAAIADQRAAALRLPPGAPRDAAVAAAQEKARALDAIEQRLHAATGPPAYLLKLDTAGDGQAIVAIGNPDTARNVVTYVPGTGTRLGGAPGDVARADALIEAARSADPTTSTAAITWIGYPAPQSIVELDPTAPSDARDPSYARHAEPALGDFQDGLRATHQGPPSHNTVLGHSYGSTVIGYAAREHGLNADDLVFIGSPGVGTDRAADLGHDPSHVWSSHIGNDPIQYAVSPRETQLSIGIDPSPGGIALILGLNPDDPGFGAQVFHSQPGTPGPDAHSQYWDRGSESWRNIGNIVTGRYTQVTR